MAQFFGFVLTLGCGFLVLGCVNYLVKNNKPAKVEPRNRRPAAVTANEMARNFQTLALPTMVGAGILAVIGLVGLLATR